MAGNKKGKRGRPVKRKMPERIDASPETIAEVVLKAKPKEVWRYEQEDAPNQDANRS